MLSFLVLLAVSFETEARAGQGKRSSRAISMNKNEQPDAAVVLKALVSKWSLVDETPEIDFLLLVNEDREELDFYPKKSLVRMMEQSGLIEDVNPASSLRETSVYYEGDGSGWKEITKPGPIVFDYRVTAKGQRYLRDAPRLIGKPVRPLRVAKSPVDIPIKPIKVVTFNKEAIEKLVADFERAAKSQIEPLFSASSATDLNPSVQAGLVSGPKLWQRLKSQAEINGLRPMGSLVTVTESFVDGKRKSTTSLSEDVPLFSINEVTLFLKSLREVFKITGSPLIRLAKQDEVSQPPDVMMMGNDSLSPDLVGLAMSFIVEVNDAKFFVLVEAVPQEDHMRYSPVVKRIEILDR
jgi:hypothetical protein